MTNNPLLGKLLSEHRLADFRQNAVIGCGCLLLFPFIFGLWSLIASLTYASDTKDADLGLYVSVFLVAGSLGLFGLWVLISYLSPIWLKRYKLEIYENGFVKKDFFRSHTCLWNEISKVNPMLLVYDKASLNTPPSEFGSLGVNTQERGVYEVYKKDGSKIIVNRKYLDIKLLDEILIPFCEETPNW